MIPANKIKGAHGSCHNRLTEIDAKVDPAIGRSNRIISQSLIRLRVSQSECRVPRWPTDRPADRPALRADATGEFLT